MPGQGRPRRAQGAKGDKGDRGLKGNKGDTGDTGPAGPAGRPGPATQADPTLELESEDSDAETAQTGEVMNLNLRIIEATGETQIFYRQARKIPSFFRRCGTNWQAMQPV